MNVPALRRELAKLRARATARSAKPPDLATLSFPDFLRAEFFPVLRDVERPDPFVAAPHVDHWAELLERKRFVGLVAFRGSLKSVVAKALIVHALRNHRRGIFDAFYFSATTKLAGEHVERLKMYADPLAQRWGWTDMTDGRQLLRYRRGDALFLCKPDGVDARSRGRRGDLFVIDDVIDPQKPVTMVEIDRALQAITSRLFPILKSARSRVLLCGTPIIKGDVVDWVRNNPEFTVDVLPALDSANRPTWKEAFPAERLARIRAAIGERSFRSNYLLESVELLGAYADTALLDDALEERR